jgi:hypothetical protein
MVCRTLIAAGIVVALTGAASSTASAATNCTTRKSGSVTITSCSYRGGGFSECRSYRSGSVVKAQGKQLGRPRAKGASDAAILKLRSKGLGMDAIRKQLGCGMGRIQQVLKAAG